MAHDFVKFPELTNSQMQIYYFQSPHKQIMENFRAEVVKVHDGDTITLRWYNRDFDFPLRFNDINSPELNEPGGKDSQSWLENKILGKEVDIIINPRNRVGKFGRLLGSIISGGMNISLESLMLGKSVPFGKKDEGAIPPIKKTIG